MIIPEFSNYRYVDGEVVDNKTNRVKALRKQGDYKLKDDAGKWRGVSVSKIKALCGDTLKLPEDAVPIKSAAEGYYIDKKGKVYSFSSAYPAGTILDCGIGSNGYLRVHLKTKCGKNRMIEVHSLVARAFIDEEYTSKGLVCLHKDNNKLNPALDNLSVGTYSQNNKDAYTDGLNPGNGLKKKSV